MNIDKKILDAEWTILKALWNKKPQTMKEIIASIQKDNPNLMWQYKTYHSYLRIMAGKGLIGFEEKNQRDKIYFPVITREEALQAESETLLSRISIGCMGKLLAMMAKNGQLSNDDARELMELTALLEKSKDGEKDDQ